MKQHLHMGFQHTAEQLARKENIPLKNAGAILANAGRHASPEARKKNPRLNRINQAQRG